MLLRLQHLHSDAFYSKGSLTHNLFSLSRKKLQAIFKTGLFLAIGIT